MEIPLIETRRVALVTAPSSPIIGRGRAPGRRGLGLELQSGQCLRLDHRLADIRAE